MKETWGGDVLRVAVRQLAYGESLPAVRTPGEVVADRLRRTGREAILAEVAARRSGLLQDVEIQDGFDRIGHVGGALMRARTSIRPGCGTWPRWPR